MKYFISLILLLFTSVSYADSNFLTTGVCDQNVSDKQTHCYRMQEMPSMLPYEPIVERQVFGVSLEEQEKFFADGPYLDMGIVVATLFSCAVLTPDDNSGADSHCFVGVVTSFLGTMLAANTDARSWAGAATGCAAGAIKEVRDHQGFGTSDYKDFLWTCIPAITTNVGLNGIITFYELKEAKMIAYNKQFTLK